MSQLEGQNSFSLFLQETVRQALKTLIQIKSNENENIMKKTLLSLFFLQDEAGLRQSRQLNSTFVIL